MFSSALNGAEPAVADHVHVRLVRIVSEVTSNGAVVRRPVSRGVPLSPRRQTRSRNERSRWRRRVNRVEGNGRTRQHRSNHDDFAILYRFLHSLRLLRCPVICRNEQDFVNRLFCLCCHRMPLEAVFEARRSPSKRTQSLQGDDCEASATP